MEHELFYTIVRWRMKNYLSLDSTESFEWTGPVSADFFVLFHLGGDSVGPRLLDGVIGCLNEKCESESESAV